MRESHLYILPTFPHPAVSFPHPPSSQHCRIASRLVVECEKDAPENVESRADHQSFFRDLRASIRWNPGGELAFATAQDHEWASSDCGSLHARHQSSRE